MFNKLTLALMLWLSSAAAQELVTIPRPVFSEERIFYMAEAQSARVEKINSPAQFYIFENAPSECSEGHQGLVQRLSQIFNFNESTVMSSLKKYFPGLKESEFSNLTVLVDSFGSAVKDFRSFYLKPQKQISATVSVDCQQSTAMSWSALFGHELTHHLNRNKNLSMWMDEMLAQMIEVENSISFPYERVRKVADSFVTPAFFTGQPVFQSSQQYGVNLLFGLYLRQVFGAKVVQVLNHDISNLTDLCLALKKYTQGRKEFEWLQNMLEPAALITHFHLALSVNLPLLNGGSIFMVPQWNGFLDSKLDKLAVSKLSLEPGSSLRLSVKYRNQFKNLPADLRVYRILKNTGQFKIVNPQEPVDGSWRTDFLLVINTSQDQSIHLEFE